jgi:aldose sugar dehydrogenase
MRGFKWFIIAGTLVVMTALGAGLIGFEIGYNQFGPQRVLNGIDRRFTSFVRLFYQPPPIDSRTAQSALLQLDIRSTTLPKEFDLARGGGMTVVDDFVLLVTQAGSFYALYSPDEVVRTNLVAPPNGHDELVLAGETLGDDYSINTIYLKYNDVLHVESAAQRFLLLSYIRFDGEGGCYRNVVSRLHLEDGIDLSQASFHADQWDDVFIAEPCLPLKTQYAALEGHMAGGRMARSDNGTILLTSGDFHFDGMRSDVTGYIAAQDADGHYGKVLELAIDGSFAKTISSGHRNPQGIAIRNGRTFVIEHGPRGGDELNVIREGLNYGWPRESYGTTYQGFPIPGSLSFGRHDEFEKPRFAWVPSIAVSSLLTIEKFHEHWAGDLLVGTLADRSLHRVRMEDDHVVYVERIPFGEPIRSMIEHPNGNLVLWTDDYRLHFLTAAQNGYEFAFISDVIDRISPNRQQAEKLHNALVACAECHSYAYGTNDKAPNLSSVFNARAGQTDFQHYSTSLRRSNIRWTEDNIVRFLVNPTDLLPGTSMPPANLDDEVARGVAAVLESLANHF